MTSSIIELPTDVLSKFPPSPVEMEPTMELRWKVEPGTSTKDWELQQAFLMKSECTKRKVWCPIRIEVIAND